MNELRDIVIAAPVCAPPEVLAAFLDGLRALRAPRDSVSYLFVDDNEDACSSALLADFCSEYPSELLLAPPRDERYVRDEHAHRWTPTLLRRVAAHRDRILARVREWNSEAVFLVDSDLVLHPDTLTVLSAAGVDIVCELFWTRFQHDALELPNAWACDAYSMVPAEYAGSPHEERDAARREFLRRLGLPGLHRVGGLGACTLIRRRAIAAGVRFSALPNLSWSEDCQFSLRAAAMGFALWADSHVPPLHLYRPADLSRIPDAKARAPRQAADWMQYQALRKSVVERCGGLGPVLFDGIADDEREGLVKLLRDLPELDVQMRANVVRPPEPFPDGSNRVIVEVDLSAGSDLTERWHARIPVAVTSEREDTVPARVPTRGRERPDDPQVTLTRHRGHDLESRWAAGPQVASVLDSRPSLARSSEGTSAAAVQRGAAR